MARLRQVILIGATVLGSWLGMQAVHESGHVLGAWLTGGGVSRVVLHPMTISRTDVVPNPRPLAVVWAGPLVGVAGPVLLWLVAQAVGMPGAFVLRFFAGFCLIANGLYIAVGSIDGVGDCGQMLRHGSERWQLWLFGAITTPIGLWLWHRQGANFGFGTRKREVGNGVAFGTLAVCLGLVILSIVVGGR